MIGPGVGVMDEVTQGMGKGAGLVELLEGMALVQRLAGLDPRTLSRGSLLEQVTETVLSFAGFEDCAIHLQESARWRCAARAGWRDLLAPDVAAVEPDPEGNAARSGYGFVELVGRGTETVHIPDLGRLQTIGPSTCGSLICAPIRAGDTLYGVFCVAHSEPCRFGVMHERLMTLAANILGDKLLCHHLLMPSSAGQRAIRAEPLPASMVTPGKSGPGQSVPGLPRSGPHEAAVRMLADLPDRVDLESHLRRALDSLDDSTGAHALCVFDIDQLRVINDTCGQEAGDELLHQVVVKIRRQLRAEDVFVRLGGDEFGLLLWDCPQQAALSVAEGLRQALRRIRFQWQGNRFRVRASFGLVCVCDPQRSPSDLLNAADAACHGAKDLGGDRVHLYTKDDQTMRQHAEDMRWVTQVNRALEDDALVMHYQPIVPVDATSYESAPLFGELLLRIRGASGELVPAGRFLPAAERYGLSTLLDTWVVERALRWLSKARKRGATMPTLWINLSGHSLSDPDFHEAMTRLLRETDVPGACLCCEITETAAIARMEVAFRFIESMRKLGCRFALDDFGSGMSSFAYLKSLNVDFVKIDGTFVRDMLEDSRSLALVRGMNEVAHAMGKLTVAEWVENEAAREILRDIGVDYVQGYLLGHPQPLEPDASESPSPSRGIDERVGQRPQ
jgi:diguanylate cyclase (GGDEF)-like protein